MSLVLFLHGEHFTAMGRPFLDRLGAGRELHAPLHPGYDGAPPDRSDDGPSKESMLIRDHRETVEISHPPARSPDLRAGTRDLPGQHARSAFVQVKSCASRT